MSEILEKLKESPHLSSVPQIDNVKILNRVRMIAIIGQVSMILFAVGYLDIKFPLAILTSVIVFELLLQVYSVWKVSSNKPFSQNELFVHIALDSMILALLVYYTGGANNPFIYLLLLFVALGSFMLEAKALVLVSFLELGLYSLLNLYQRPLELGEQSPLASFHLHLAGMWVNFFLTVALLAFFGLVTRYAMLRKEKQLHSLRERQLQDEQILGLGIMAASAAHELGTPLATMAIIIDDLAHEASSSEISEDLQLLSKQIAVCKGIIGSLNDKSQNAKLQLKQENHLQPAEFSQTLHQQIEKILENWLVYRPNINLQQTWNNRLSMSVPRFSISVEQAITNLLDNAADASLENNSAQVEMIIDLNGNNVVIEILDYGKGISLQKQQNLGGTIQDTDKQDGLGWGMFLSNVSIERVGGNIQLINKENAGTLTRIIIPVSE
jgi:two-component system, sensor histidine kinase RegB